jgi:hypothetical protein
MIPRLRQLLKGICEKRFARQGHGKTDAMTDAVENSATLDFSMQLARASLAIEVDHLRQETQQLRADVAQLALDVRQLKLAHNTSPMYAEAMTLAQQGVSAANIADRCGISLGEAELVVSLAQSDTKGG